MQTYSSQSSSSTWLSNTERGTASHSKTLLAEDKEFVTTEEAMSPKEKEQEELAVKKKKKFPNIFSVFRFKDRADVIFISIGVTFAVIQGILPPLNMIVLGDVMNSMGYGMDEAVFHKMIVSFAGLTAAGLVCGTLNAGCLEYASERQIRRLKQEYLRSVLRQDIGYFDIVDVGTLASKIEQTCVHVRDGTGMKFGLIFQFGSQFIGGYIVGLVKGWKMALVLTAVIPLLGGTMGFMITKVRKMIALSKEEYEAASSVAEEALPVMRTVASFNAEERIIENFNVYLDQSERSDQKAMLWRAIAMCAMMGLLFLSYALGWWYAGRVVSSAILDSQGTDHDTAGECLTVFFSIIIASFSVGQIMPNVNSTIIASKSIQTVNEVIDRQSKIDPSLEIGVKGNAPLKGSIEFKNVKFAFPSRKELPVYQNVSFKIEAGETVALVGPSGCGKSTIIQMIERFYDPDDGVIEIDGLDSRSYNLQWLRENMALVSQEPKLFSETVMKNVAYGRENVSSDEIVEACKKANAHKFVCAFPDNYQTNVGEGGSLLSGGQKQRVAIARAILRDPSILILDEATSALDNESEKIVQKALDELIESKRRTTIIIAHRLTTIRHADKIIVIDNPTGYGSVVVEHGTHDELMKNEHGLYRALVLAQSAIAKTDSPGELAVMEQQLARDATVGSLASKFLSGSLRPEQMLSVQKSASIAKLVRQFSKQAPQTEEEELQQVALERLESKLRQSKIMAEKSQKKKWKFWSKRDREAAAEIYGVPDYGNAKIRSLFKYMKEDWWVVLIGCISAVFTGGAYPVISVMISKFIGVFYNPEGDTYEDQAGFVGHQSNKLSFVFIGIAVAIACFVFVQQYCFGYSGERLVARMRKITMVNLMYQDMEFFDNSKNNTGYLSSVLSADCATVRGVTGDNLSIILQNLMTFIIALIIAFTSCAKLAGVSLCVYGLIVPANFLQIRNTKPAQVKPDAVTDTESAGFVLNEAVTSLRVIAAYGLQEKIVGRYTDVLDKEFHVGAKNAWITGCVSGFASAIMYGANAAAFQFAGHLMEKDEGLGIEELMRTILSLTMAGNGIGRNTAFATDSKKAKSAAQNIFEILKRVPKMDVRDPSGVTSQIDGRVEFNEMRFRYPTRAETPILNNVTFTVEEGETVALVGESGCGKSTIIQLLERFYDLEASNHLKAWIENRNKFVEMQALEGLQYPKIPPPDTMYHGEVVLAGTDIQDYNLKYLRSQLGLVSQEPALFDVSVEENIRWGKPDATLEEVQHAAKMAHAHDFVSALPRGYGEKVGKGGMRLSGGQKQRVAIARAIIRDPKILLLDEATSALDPESEEIVQKALDSLVEEKKRTTLVIAHRLTTIRNADKIVVFVPETGVGSRIVEQGNHETLMQIPNGVYRKLVELSGTPGSSA